MCLMGAVATWGIVEWARDDDDDKDDDHVDPGPDTQHAHQIHDDEHLVTGPEDDIVTAPRMVDNIELRTGNGDDTINLGINQGTVRSGPGDDHLTFTNSTDVAGYGGADDDTLIGNNNASTSLYGGHGDDVIEAQFLNDRLTLALADGGEGDDTLRATVEGLDLTAGEDGEIPDILAPHLTGGLGEDRFEINLLVRDVGADDTSAAQHSVVVTDFHPDQDELIVDPLAEGSDENYVPSHYNFFRSADGTYTDLRIGYNVTDPEDGPETIHQTIRIMGGDFPTDQIKVLGLEQRLTEGSGNPETHTVRDGETVIGRGGDDTISGAARDAIVYGGAGHDSFSGSGEGSRYFGHAGNDNFNLDLVNSEAYGGTGHDQMQIDATRSVVEGGPGRDSLSGKASLSTIYGGDGNDTFEMSELTSSHLDAGAGNDIIRGMEAATQSTIMGGEGNDILIAQNQAGAEWYGGEGDDHMVLDLNRPMSDATIYDAGAGHDRVTISISSNSHAGEHVIAPEVTAGEGRDTYEIKLGAGVMSGADDAPLTEGRIMNLGDFTSGEDHLYLDPIATISSSLRFEGITVERTSDTSSAIRLEYTVHATDGADAYTQIQTIGVPGIIAMSDITLGPIPSGLG